MGILDTVQTVSDLEFKFKGMIYGHQGSGKTQLASTFPTPIFFDFEKSTDTLIAIGRTDIPVERKTTFKRFEQVLLEAVKDESPYETIVIDTANSMQAFQLGEWMREQVRKNSNRDVDLPFQMDYRKSTARLSNITDALQSCNKHVVVNCQERLYYEKDEDKLKLVSIRPDITQRLADMMEQTLSNVLYLQKKDAVGNKAASRTLYFESSGKFFAKNRLGMKEISITDPTYNNIFGDKFNGNS